MDLSDLTGDVDLTGKQIGAFVDLVERVASKAQHPSPLHTDRLRAAVRIERAAGETAYRVTLDQKRGIVTIPIAGV